VPLGGGFVALAGLVATTGLVGGCGNDEPEEQVYCADENGVIVDDDDCDDDERSRSHFFFVGAFGRGLLPGHRLTGGTRFRADDASARRQYGLPGSGKVSNGSVVQSGFGSGGG
jgi:hypothetical protein